MKGVISLALTWDGARWPVRSLPPKARAFLGDAAKKIPSARETAKILRDDHVREIRVCWVPRLKGGESVLATPFPLNKRINFRVAKIANIGEILAVTYQR